MVDIVPEVLVGVTFISLGKLLQDREQSIDVELHLAIDVELPEK